MKHVLIAVLALCTLNGFAQDKKELAELDIATTTVCEMCKTTIEEDLIYEKGVKSVNVNLDASLVRITYDAGKNTPEDLRAALIKLGYGADGVPGDPKAFAKLPLCCQKEGCGKVKHEEADPK